MSVICCVSAAVESLTPFIISSQINDNVIETWKIEGFRMGVDHGTGTQAKGICHCNTFSAVCNKVLVPFIERLRTNPEFIGKWTASVCESDARAST
jgi:hypothetical protein